MKQSSKRVEKNGKTAKITPVNTSRLKTHCSHIFGI